MKLLIVDDEILTRTGLISSISWEDLGIDEVYEAADGVEGLKTAEKFKPEIILSDVRMPRMNGIDMLCKIREISPDTVFIFMSGYSDKEYLKAAIRLHAVNYVEKPLDLIEIEQAVRTAAERHLQIVENRQSKDMKLNIFSSKLAIALTHPWHSVKESSEQLVSDFCRRYGTTDVFHSAATVIVQASETLEPPIDYIQTAEKRLHDMIRPLHLHIISTAKNTNLFVFHIFRRMDFTPQLLLSLESYLKDIFTPVRNFHFAVGTPVSGLHKIYDSYSSAVVALQSAYFFSPGVCLTPERLQGMSGRGLSEQITASFATALEQTDKSKIEELCRRLYECCHENSSLLRRTVESLYYQLFTDISAQRKSRQITNSDLLMTPESILEHTEGFFFYQDLHQSLIDALADFWRDLNSTEPENSSVYLIKSYIRRHYGNPMLSTKEISEYASLSASYACTLFKNETGQTLNQYLTEYRLKKAQELLDDPRNTVYSVSAMVGYNDSNYFSKAFKKYTGISPSVYRERRIK